MNKKTFFIIGILMCLLFTIPLVSAADLCADSDLIDNSVIGSHINSQAITTSDANSLDTDSIDNVLSNANINAKGINSNNNANGIINQNLTKDPEIGIDDSLINNSEKITDINSGNNKNSKDKNNLRANALGEGEGTFAQLYDLIQAAAGSTITLSNNYKFVAGDDDAYKSGIIIDKELTINGDGHTIDGSNLARIFYTQGEVVITLNNLVLINGNAGDGDGGAIIWDSHSGHINNVNISNCVAQNGGAIFIGHVGHDEPSFIENITIKYSNATNGGGIYLLTPTAMHNITCINCTASQDGGAIYAYSDGQGRGTDIFTFYNNTAKNGGAAYIRGNNLTITDVDAQNNSATEYGGAIYADGNHLVLDGIKFINNHAIGHDNASGGAIFFDGSNDSVVNNVHFENNSAFKNGGAICWGPTSYFGELFNSNFTNNTAGRSGGAVYWRGDNGTVENCSFIDNRANGTNLESFDFVTEDGEQYQITGGNGGAIVWLGSVGFINNSNFTNNYAKLNGGAILFRADTEHGETSCNNTNVINCSFIDNDAGQNGGAVGWNDLAANGTVSNSKFYNNTAARSGGAIFWKGQEGTIADSDFVNNSANGTNQVQPPGYLTPGGNGGAIIITGSEMNITNSNFTNNTARARGGAVYLQRNNNTNIINSKFENNSAGTNGGALDFYQGAENGHVINSTFLNNSANKTGGSIYWNGKTGVINGSLFRDNIALNQGTELNGTEIEGYGDGGAIIWTGSDGIIENSTFINNTANRRGGAIFLQGGESETCENVTVTNCTFDANIARTNGGAIDWFKGARNGHVYNSTFINNIANRTGGAIFWNGINGTIIGSNFTNNTAKGQEYGISPNGTNTTGGDGGAIMWSGPNGVIDLCNFDNNSAKWRGGAIFLQKYDNDILCENTTVSNSNFTNNHAGSNGGAIEWTLGARYGHLINSTFINNTADRSGGAVFWYGLYGEINGSTFTNNSALGNYTPGSDTRPDVDYIVDGQYCGGAVYIRGNSTKLYDDEFYENNATRRGGAIYIYGDNNTVDKSDFVGHLAHEEGGAIYVDGKNTTIGNSTFTNNTSWDDGGAITWEGDLGRIYNITCLNNSGIGNTHTSSGGTISIYGSNLTMDTINITHGYVTETDRSRAAKGGGIFLTGNNVNITNVEFNDCFTNSTAVDSSGGALYIIGNNTNVVNATFTDSRATDDGGSVYVLGENCTLNNTVFTTSSSQDDGGAVAWHGNNGKIYNMTATDCYGNSAIETSRGGTLYIAGNNTSMNGLNITGSFVSYDENPSTEPIQGGAIYLSGNDCNITNIHINDSHVLFNGINPDKGDEASGGAMYIIGNNTSIVNGTFSNNTAWADGGAIFVEGENFKLNNTNFIDNVAHNDGGAIQVEGNNAKIYKLTADDNYADSLSGSSQGGTLIITGNKTSMDLINISNSYVDGATGRNAIRGGAIFLTGNDCNITNSSFTNCSVKWEGTNSSGGALYILGNNTQVINANFTNNTSPNDGGAIYVSGSDVAIVNGNFSNNTAKLRGGAIFLIDNKNSQINGSYFENNHAGRNGGAIDFYAGAEDGLVSSCDFVNNTADASGGAIFWEGTRGVIEYSNFTGSRAFGNNTESSALAPNKGRGGSIIWHGDRGEIRECVFDDSQSQKEGSALYIIGNDFAAYSSNVTNSVSNTSSGTIYIQGTYAKIGDCYMDNNTVKEKGAGIYVRGNFVSISGTTINNSSSGDVASAIYVEGNRTEIKDSLISNNVANKSGAVYIAGSRSTVTNVNFENNTAKTSAGAIYISGDDTIVTKSNFTNNTSPKGGAILYEGQRITISYSNFDKNRAYGTTDAKGGSISIKGKSGDSIIGCNFTDSSSGSSGGSIHWLAGGEGGLIQNCTFINSTTDGINVQGQGHGGAIIWEANTNGVIDNCTFINCEAKGTKNAGAIYMGTSSAPAINPVISNCTVINCTQGERGAINIFGTNATVVNSQFINLTYLRDVANGFQAIQFESLTGGAVINCTFENITGSGSGSGIRIMKGSDVIIANNTFINCNNTKSGGAFHSAGISGYQIFENNTFINITSAGDGGAAYFSNAVTSFKNNTFINNSVSSAGKGGAVFLNAATTVDNSTFINNTGANQGGAIYSSNLITINDSYFESNIANGGTSNIKGGAVFGNSGGIRANNSTFIANEALHNGGALFANSNGGIYISNSTFEHNIAPMYDGGAIYTGGTAYINESSTFMYNNATTASAIRAKSVYINDTVLLENQAHFRQWADRSHNLQNDHVHIYGTLRGEDVLLNAIYADTYGFKNVTYCGENGEETNTDDVTSARSYNEVHILVVLEVYNSQNELIDTLEQYTDANGHYTFDFDLLDASNHSFKVIHPEDNYYTGAEYTIGKALSDLVITSQNITHPEDENISFQVTGGLSDIPSGNITVIINDTNGNIIYNDTVFLNETGEALISLPRLNATEYYINAKYNGDDNYLPDNGTDVFHVSMGESFINIGIENYTYNETRNITITIPYIEDGKVTVIVSNENYTQLYTVYITEGTEELEIELPILDAGEYQIDAVFHGNNNYFPSENQTNFTVFKAASIINVTAENVTGGEHAVANIHIDPEVATQTVDVVVKDEAGEIVAEFEGLGLLNSATSITLPVLPKGKYNVTVSYGGDKNHNESVNSTIFYVTRDLFPIEINASNMTYGEDQVINITVPADADPDKLWIKLNWTENDTVTHLGYTIDPETGLIQIDTSALANRLDAGNYTIDVYYEGDDDYLSNSSSFTFEVIKANVTMTVTPENITYGAIENITVEIPELNEIGQNDALTLYVNSTTNESIRFVIEDYDIGTDGKAIWNVLENILPAGDYIVDAVYAGSNNYNPTNRTERFTVSKAAVWIEIDVNNIFVDDTEVINVTVHGVDGGTIPSGEIKIIVRTIDDKYELNATGQYSISLPNEVEGTAISVTVIYYGDNNYNGTDNTTDYNVTRKNTTTTVDALTPIKYGTIEDLNMTVNYTDATGTITLYINSTVEGFDNITKVFTLDGTTGKVNWDIDELILPVGTYEATAVYSGDRKYFNSTSQIKLIVVEQNDNYEITVEANNTVYREDQVIVVTVPEDANGTVTIVIVGTDISLTKQVENGQAVFTIPSGVYDFLEVHDDYNVTATYNGDANYAAGKTADDLFNVTKADSHIDVEAQNITYSQIENITVSLPDINASGKLVITINNSSGIVRTQTVDVFTTTDGVIYPFADLASGNYTVKVVYSDDHNYNDSEDSYDFEVAKADPTLSENSPDIVYGNNENITVIITGEEGALVPTGTIEVKVDGVTVDTIEIGNALEYIVTKPVVDPRHNVTVVYSGDSNYNDATIYGEFAVSQNDTYEFEEDSPNIVYANNETITITLPNDATGTVYLVVNGSYYTPIGIDDNHQAVFNISSPIVGEYAFTAYYSGDFNYVAKDISGAFNVTKADVNLAETHTATITYGADNTIIVTIEGVENGLDPTGTIVVKVDDVEIGNQTIGTDGLVFVLEKPIVDPVHNITVIYSGDNNYNDKTITGTFEVIKNTTVDLSENSPDIFYLENETVTVTIAGDATGTITVKLGEETIGIVTIANDNITEDDKEFSFTIVKPDGGVYDNLTVVYGGDTNYETKTITGAFTVSPIDPNITEDSPDIVYGANETITITVPDGASGTLIVKVSNASGIVKEQSLIIGEDNLEVTLEKPAVGNYTISIEYSGCDNYTAKTVEGAFEVTKASNEITVVPTNITYGDSETITVTVPEDATGTVTITIGDYTDTKEITAGSATVEFTIPKAVGEDILEVNNNYIVFANYSGDSNYQSVIAYAPFHVSPANTTTTVRVENITYGKDEIINVTVTGVPNGEIPRGFVTITINGTDISLTKAVDSEGNAQFNVSGLIAGEYTVNASFVSSSLNYTNSVGNASFNVTKADVADFNETTDNNITAANITYGDDETITIEFAEKNITGNVTIRINGVEVETKALDKGKVTFTIPNGLFDYLEANEYSVLANYSGDDNYNAKEGITTEFKVDKSNVNVVVDPIDIIYKEIETINVTVTGVIIDDEATGIAKYNLTGKVTIYIDDVENQTLDISQADANGVLHFNVEGLAVGPHNVTAKYWNDRNYNENNATSDFNVANALPEDMKVIPQNITYHIESENITIDLGEVLNGTLVVYLNGSEIYNAEVIDKDQIKLSPIENLAVGNYTVRAVFIANDDSVDVNASFEVRQAPTTVTVEPINISYGQIENITVYVDNALEDKFNLTGSVTIYINGRELETKAIGADGKVIFNVEGLAAADDYIVEARYHSDVNYLNSTGTGLFNVTKAQSDLEITVENITYGDNETIAVTVPIANASGTLVIKVNGSEINRTKFNGEDSPVVEVLVEKPAAGEYNVTVEYIDDVNYENANDSAIYTVSKANPIGDVNITATNVTYGENVTVTVTVPEDASGNVTITIGDYTETKELSSGTNIVTFTVPDLEVNNYVAYANYSGDNNYNSSLVNVPFHVDKAQSHTSVSPINISYNDDETITVVVSDDNATGFVTITIEGTDVELTKAVDQDGTAIFTVKDLVVGDYTVNAVYHDDRNYNDSSASSTFSVNKAEVQNMTLSPVNITYGDNETITVTIADNNISGNVSISVNGTEYGPIELDNGRAVFTVPGLTVGDYEVVASYSGDDNYNASTANGEFTVDKAEASVIVVASDIDYGDDETITVIVDGLNVTGNVTIKVNGTEYDTKEIDNRGRAVFTIPGLKAGEYEAVAVYNGDDNHISSQGSDPFTVSRITPDMNVTVENITYGDNETITVNLPEDATGAVNITIDGVTYPDVPIVNGAATITVPGIAPGEHDVTVDYPGDDNYNGTTITSKFDVDKANATVDVGTVDIDYSDNETITVTVESVDGGVVPTGTVNITITDSDGNEINYTDVPLVDGVAKVTVPDLEADKYSVDVTYSGDTNYNDGTGEGNFSVGRISPDMNVTVENITYGDNETITVSLPEDATGTVNITIDGVTYPDVPIENGIAKITVPGIGPGEHDVTVDYPGDDNYNGTTVTSKFDVDKADSYVEVGTMDIDYGDDESIAIKIYPVVGGDVPTGTVNITITDSDGNEITYTDVPLVDGEVEITVPGLDAGNYEVNVTYSGDTNYNDGTGHGSFSVGKVVPDMDVNTQNITYGDNETVTVNLPEDATGTVNVTIDGVTYPDVPIENGIAKITVPGITPGEHNVTVDYSGDDNYRPTSSNSTFDVEKVEPSGDVETKDIDYGEDEPITITINPVDGGEVPTGTVNITITDSDGNEITYTDVPLSEGTATINVPDLAAGEYSVKVNYSGDDNYKPTETEGSFTISQIEPEMDVETEDIGYGDDETITVHLPEDATGTVNITIDGVVYPDVPIENGTATITVPGISAGEHNVTVDYPGDGNYSPSSESATFTVDKANSAMDIDTQDITYGDEEPITVTVEPVDGGITPTGTVNITITDKDGNKQTYTDVPLVDGKAVIEVPDLAAGNYTVDAKYSGDENYDANSTSGAFEVARAVPHIEIHVYDIIYGDVEVLTVSCDAPGYVDVTVNGITVTIPLDDGHEKRVFASIVRAYNGKATLDLENLAVGTYPASAVYRGNENYTSVSDNDTFHVIKANTTTQISVDDIKVGEDAVINVEVSHDRGSEKINTNITVTVDGKEYTVELSDGKGTLTVSDLSAGEHTVSATFPGDHNYTESSNTTSFKASKVSPSFDVESENIKVGDDETVTVSLPEDATGNVTITIDGKKYTAPVINGTASFKIPGIKAGNHTVNAEYSGDDKYAPAKGKDTFTVDKVKPTVDVDAPAVKEGKDGVITVTVPDDATGTVTVEIDGKNYTATIKDGKAVFNIPGLSPGKHSIKVYYSGDDKYMATVTDGGEIDVIANEHNKSDNGSKHIKEQKGIDLESKATGNPILVLMLVLFSLIIIPIKRSKDDEEEDDESR